MSFCAIERVVDKKSKRNKFKYLITKDLIAAASLSIALEGPDKLIGWKGKAKIKFMAICRSILRFINVV
jgi:hypothetical protein